MYIRLLLVIAAILILIFALRIKESIAASRPVYQQGQVTRHMQSFVMPRLGRGIHGSRGQATG